MTTIQQLGVLILIGAAGITLGADQAHAQPQTNEMGDSFVTQWTEDFTKATKLPDRWNVWWGAPAPTEFDSVNGMKFATTRATISTAPKDSYSGTTLFGRYAGRIYCAPAKHVQTFWLVKPVFQNDDWNEIDIEIYGSNWIQENTILPTYTLHYGDGFPATHYPGKHDKTVVSPPGWHEWMIDWTPNYVAWYMDGKLLYVNNNNSTMPGWTESTGNGAEAMLFPQALMIGSQEPMAITSASYSSLQMQSFEATKYDGHSGGTIATDAKGSQCVNSLANPGDYLRYDAVQPQWRNISVHIDCSTSGAQILVHTGSPTGPVIGTINVPVTRGAEWVYTDLEITNSPTQISSAKRKFNPGWQARNEVGKTLIITGGTGFTPGTYKITAVEKGVATLNAEAGQVGSKGGQAALQYNNPIRYTLASANLQERSGPPQSLYLTFAGDASGLSLYNIYFFGTQPSSWPQHTEDTANKATKDFHQ